MATSIGRFYAILGADTSEFTRKMGAIGTKMSAVGKKMTMGLTLPILALAGAAVKFGAEFEQALMNATSVTGVQGAEIKKVFKEMEGIAREMGKTTIFSAKEAADALYFMASAGWKVDQMGKAIAPTLALAAATQSDLAFTTETVVSTLNQFQLESIEAVRVADVFASAIGNSQATLERLKISMSYIGPLAQTMGHSLEDTTATLMGLFNAGFEASTAGTALRMAFAKLMDPMSKTREGLDKLGISVHDVNPELNSQIDIIGRLEEAGAGASDVIKIFGVRAGPAMAALIATGTEALKKHRDALDDEGAAARMMEAQLDTLKSSWKIFTSAVSEVAIQISQILNPMLRKAVAWLREMADKFAALPDKTKKTILIIAGIAAAIGPLLMIGGKLLILFSALPGKIASMGKALMFLANNPVVLLVAALAALYVMLKKVQKAKDEQALAEDRLAVASARLEEKLRKITDAAGLTRAEMVQLKRKYDDNTMALLHAIHTGKEDVKLKEAMVKIGKENVKQMEETADAMDEESTEADELKKRLDEMNKSIKEAIEEQEKAEVASTAWAKTLEGLGIKTIPQKKAAVAELKETLAKLSKEYEDGLIDLEDYLRASKELKTQIEDLSTTLITTAVPAHRDLGDIVSLVPDKLKDLIPPIEEVKKTEKELAEENKKLAAAFGGLATGLSFLASSFEGVFGGFASLAATAVGQISQQFEKLKKEGKSTGGAILESMGPEMTGQIGAAFGSMITGTTKNFGKLGAAIGSAIGTPLNAIVPGLGTIVSGLAGLIGSLFKKKETEEEKAAARAAQMAKQFEAQTAEAITVMSKYGEISEDTAKKIAELRKTHVGYIAESLAFADVIRDVTVTQGNLNDLWKQSIGIIHQVAEGQISAAEGGKVLSDVFTEMVNGAKELGKEGSAGMVAFILEARNLGIEIASVTEYVLSQLDRIPSALDTLVGQIPSVGESIDELSVKLKVQQNELMNMEDTGSEAYKTLQKEIKETQTQILEQTKNVSEHGSELERLGGLALGTFNAMLGSGQTWNEAIKAMAPTLNELREKYDELGIEATGSLAKLFKVTEVTEANKELFSAIDANNTILEALGNTGWLTAETFKGFADQAVEDFETLRKKFGDDDMALRAMGPTLQNLADLQEMYGFEVDESTQKLLDLAKKHGVVTERQESEQEQQERLFGELADTMSEIMEKLADDIGSFFKTAFSDAFDDVENQAETARGRIDGHFEGMNYGVGLNVDSVEGGDRTSDRGGRAGLKTGGIAFTPTVRRIAEVEPEIITPFSKVKDLISGIAAGLAGGGGTQIYQFAPVIKAMDSQDVYKFMSGRGREAFVKMIQTNPRGITQEIKTQTDRFRGQSSSSHGKGRGKKK